MKLKLLVFILIPLVFSCKSTGKEQESSSNKKELTVPEYDIPIQKGELLYRQHCGTCHQYDGNGVPGMYPPLLNSLAVQGNSIDLIKMVLEGIMEPTEGREEIYAGVMPPQDYLSDEEISDILTYIRTKYGNNSSPVLKSEASTVRKKLQF